jgi:hypothetical protein
MTMPSMTMSTSMAAPSAHDRFSGFDDLQPPGGIASTGAGTAMTSRTLSLHSSNNSNNPQNSLNDLGGWMAPVPTQATAMPSYSTNSSWKVSAPSMPPAMNDNEDSDNGFVMGGTVGAGLEPAGPAPAAAPPPPPPPAGGFW